MITQGNLTYRQLCPIKVIVLSHENSLKMYCSYYIAIIILHYVYYRGCSKSSKRLNEFGMAWDTNQYYTSTITADL